MFWRRGKPSTPAPRLLEQARGRHFEDEPEDALALVEEALVIDAGLAGALELKAELQVELGQPEQALATWRQVLAAEPQRLDAIRAVAGLLIDVERAGEALELLATQEVRSHPELAVCLGEALFVTGRSTDALRILDDVTGQLERSLKHSMAPSEAARRLLDEAQRLRNDVHAELHGREAGIEAPLRAGKLDARAGVNYTLMGAALAAKSVALPLTVELESPDAGERRAAGLATHDPDRLVLLGCVELRRGKLDRARTLFEEARAAGADFAALFGMGAVLDHEQHDLRRRVLRLPVLPEPAALAAVVPELPALTLEERRVVVATASPLGGSLDRIAAAGARIRILPIDVRVTDLPELASAAGQRASDDHRSYDALGGVATHGCAAAKIEELLDVVSPAGLTFAHELAHLAYFHADWRLRRAVARVYEHALAVGYACDEYQLSNADEFFAVSYTDFLRRHYGLPVLKERDDAGVADAIDALFLTPT